MPRTEASPDAVRRAFASRRLRSAWAMLDAARPGERAAAIEGVARVLEADGLTLGDVLSALLSIPLVPLPRTEASEPTAAATTPTTVPTVRVVSGRDVPDRVGGRVLVLDERKGRRGPEMTVAVVGFDARWDPISVRDPATMEALRAAAAKGGLTQIAIERATTARARPVATRVGMGIAF